MPKDLTDDEILEMYLDTWRDSLVPLCANKSGTSPKLCDDFRPSPTNNGMCFTKNQGQIDDIYKSAPYIGLFKEVFLAERSEFPISKNMGSGVRFKYSFMLDANRVMDLKNGIHWNQTTGPVMFRIALHHPNDIPDIRDGSYRVSAGNKIVIRVNANSLQSDPQVKSIKLEKRQCKFPEENEDLSVFRWYSRYFLIVL